MSQNNLIERSLKAVWHPCTQMKQHEHLPLIPIVRGEGAWLFDQNGKRYLDAISSWWVNLFGHCNPRINAAIIDQLGKIEHVMLAGATHAPAVELAERLSALAPAGLGHCFYASDGASAVEIALKMSFHYWRNASVRTGKTEKNQFICLQNSYHGETLGALSVTDVAVFKDAYAPLLRQCALVPTPDYRYARQAGSSTESPQDCAIRAAAALRTHLEQHHASTAAFIVEPLVQCAAGMGMYHADYLKQARLLCDEFEVHLIADEIAVGFGRTGTLFACEQAGIAPDLMCLSKGLSGGYLPLSAVLATDNIYQAFYHDDPARGFLHSHSYSGNALACRAALATLDIFEQDDVIAKNRNTAAILNEKAGALSAHPKVKNFRQCGMIWAFEADTDDPVFARKFFAAALQNELLLRPIGKTIYFMPPYIIDANEMDFLVQGTIAALNVTL